MQLMHQISLAVAIGGGLVLYYEMPNLTGFTFMYLFSIACGGAGSRLAAIARNGI